MFTKCLSISNDFDHCLIVMSGVSGSGKSTLAIRIQEEHPIDCYLVSRDEIKFSHLKEGDEYFTYEDEVEEEYYKTVSEKLKKYKYVIADATQITLNSRRKFFNNVEIPENTKIIDIWVEAGKDVCKMRNSKKTGRGKVPNDVIDRQFQYKVSPREEEPFHVVYFVIPDDDLGISSHSFHVKSIKELLEEI